MRKKNGYVFMETIVVVSILSLILVLMFSSFSFILRKSRQKVNYDTTEMIYKTYYVKTVIESFKPASNNQNGVWYYINNLGSECAKMSTYNSYVCDLSSNSYNGRLYQLKAAFEVEKFYYLNPYEVMNSNDKDNWLNLFDATTIDYLKNIGKDKNYNVLIVKYKKTYNKTDDTYEIYHSSIDLI